MPKILARSLSTALGLALDMWGTLSGLCLRRDPRTGVIVYWERRHPGALSPKQQAHRVRFQRGYEQWRTLSPDEQTDWGLVADRFTTRMVGAHLFLRIWWYQDTRFLDQAQRHLHISLVLPGP